MMCHLTICSLILESILLSALFFQELDILIVLFGLLELLFCLLVEFKVGVLFEAEVVLKDIFMERDNIKSHHGYLCQGVGSDELVAGAVLDNNLDLGLEGNAPRKAS